MSLPWPDPPSGFLKEAECAIEPRKKKERDKRMKLHTHYNDICRLELQALVPVPKAGTLAADWIRYWLDTLWDEETPDSAFIKIPYHRSRFSAWHGSEVYLIPGSDIVVVFHRDDSINLLRSISESEHVLIPWPFHIKDFVEFQGLRAIVHSTHRSAAPELLLDHSPLYPQGDPRRGFFPSGKEGQCLLFTDELGTGQAILHIRQAFHDRMAEDAHAIFRALASAPPLYNHHKGGDLRGHAYAYPAYDCNPHTPFAAKKMQSLLADLPLYLLSKGFDGRWLSLNIYSRAMDVDGQSQDPYFLVDIGVKHPGGLSGVNLMPDQYDGLLPKLNRILTSPASPFPIESQVSPLDRERQIFSLHLAEAFQNRSSHEIIAGAARFSALLNSFEEAPA